MNTVLIAAVIGGNALLSVLLIPLLGMYGSALGTALALGLAAFALVKRQSQRFRSASFLTRRLGRG